MEKKLNILRSQLTRIAGWKGNKGNYFNSPNHLIETIESNIGWSKQTIKKTLDQMIQSGEVLFDNNKLHRMKFIPSIEYDRVPDYILLTNQIPDAKYHLDIKDWKILCMIYRKAKHIHYVFENELDIEQKSNSEESYFFGIDYICRNLSMENIDFTYSEVRNSIQKLKLYFGDSFHRPPTKKEITKRYGIYKNFYSWNFEIPERSQWKSIIMRKIMELTNKDDIKYSRYKIVTPEEKLKLDKANLKGANLSILDWSRMIQIVEIQLDKLQEGKEQWKSIEEHFNSYLLQIKYFLTKLAEMGEITELMAHRLEREASNIKETSLLKEFYLELQSRYSPLVI
jgi:hypothetical protein